jgi:predicted acylesterase/phospholipase RssA
MTRRASVRRFVLPIASCFLGAAGQTGLAAQQGHPHERPVPAEAGVDALVLSTGSSRGLAHAGAVLGLERRGFDPDLVIGASMGAVIGSLYAAGYSAEQLWDLILGTDWGDLFMGSPVVVGPERRFLFPSLNLGLDVTRREVSSGFVPEWRVNRLLTHLLFDADARARSDFDRLPRRYRSVTADLSTGAEVVLAHGDLARAVRASMGTPGFFSPTRWGDQLLIDGGIADYLPVRVARALGARRVVAIDVSRSPPEIGRTDPTTLAGRSLSLLMRNALPDTTPPDVLIQPSVDPDFPGAVFPAQPKFLLDLGVEAALDVDVSPTAHPHAHDTASAPTRLARLDIEGGEPVFEQISRRAFAPAIGAYRAAAVLEGVDRLYATGLLDGVWPRVERRPGSGATTDSVDVLVLALTPHPRLGLTGSAGYENDRGGRIWALLDARRSLLGDPLEARLGAGTDGIERWFNGAFALYSSRFIGVAWNAGLHRRQITVPFFDPANADLQVRRTGGWGGALYRQGDLVASAAVQAERLQVESGPAGGSFGGIVRIASAVQPTLVVGEPSELSVEARGGVLDYATVSGRTTFYLPSSMVQLAAVLDGAVALGDPPPDARPSLGEGHGMPGVRWGDERGRGRLLAGIDAASSMLGSGWGRLRLRAGVAPQTVHEVGALDAWVAGAALEAGWATPFGPLQLGWGVNTRGSHRIDVSLGGAF